MSRLRALAYAACVSVGVFVYLALPTLRDLFGPVANLVVYGFVALLAGVVTYGLVFRLYDVDHEEASGSTGVSTVPEADPEETAERAVEPSSEDIDRELETIRDDQ